MKIKNNNNEFVPNFDIPDDYKPDKKSKKKIIFPAAIMLLIFFSVLCTALYLNSKLEPAEKLKNRYIELFKTSKNSPLNAIGIDKLIENNTQKHTSTFDITLDEFPLTDIIAGAGFSVESSHNKNISQSENIISATYRGVPILSCDLFTEKNNIYLTAPSVFDEIIFICMDDYSGLLNSSNISLIKDGITINYMEDKSKIKLSISSESIDLIADEISNSQFIKNFIDTETLNNLISYLKVFFKNGIDIYTTFNSRNQITAIDFSNSFGIFSAKAELKLDFNFTGNKHPADSFDGTIVFRLGENAYALAISQADKSNDKNYSRDYSVSFTTPYISNYSLLLKITETYTDKTGSYNCFFDLSHVISDEPIFYANINGSLSNIKKGHSFTFDFDNCTIGSGGDNTIAQFSGSYEYRDSTAKIKKPDGSIINLYAADEKSINKIIYQIDETIEKYKSMYSQLY